MVEDECYLNSKLALLLRRPHAWRHVQTDRFAIGACDRRVHLLEDRVVSRDYVLLDVPRKTTACPPTLDHPTDVLHNWKRIVREEVFKEVHRVWKMVPSQCV